MPWASKAADLSSAPAPGGPSHGERTTGMMDPFERVRQERRLAALFFTGLLAVCAAMLWLFHGEAVIGWFMMSGGVP